MSRVRTTEPYVQQKVSLPATLVARFNMLHWDPVNSKAKYGAISGVVTKLLTDYVNRVENGGAPFDPSNSSEPPVETL